MSETTWTTDGLYEAILRGLAGVVANCGVSRGELARRLGVKPQTLASWLSNRTPLRVRDALEILQAAGEPARRWLAISRAAVDDEEMEVRWQRPGFRLPGLDKLRDGDG